MNSTLIQTDRFALSETERSAIEHELHHYEDPRAASIEALKIVQKERGWVPDGALYAIGEILGFMNGARTQEELVKFGCYWWRFWVTKEKCEKRGLVELNPRLQNPFDVAGQNDPCIEELAALDARYHAHYRVIIRANIGHESPPQQIHQTPAIWRRRN